MKDYYNEFILYLKTVKKSSENTIRSYSRDVFAYLNHFNQLGIKDISLIDEEILCNYIRQIESSNSATTVSRIVSSLKCYYKFLQSIDLCKQLDLKRFKTNVKTTKTLPIVLENDEIIRLIQQPDTSCLKGIRDKAMLELLYATGITVSELLSLNIFDLNLTLGLLNINNRTIPIYNDALKTLSLYINQVRNVLVPNKYDKYLFCNLNGEPITRQGVWKIIKEHSQKAGIDKVITPHTIRHTFAVHLLENGANISEVKQLLGHASSTTAQIYVELIKSKYRKSYKNYHPMSK